MVFAPKPENVYKRAVELEAVSKPHMALEELLNCLTVKGKKQFTPDYERVALKFIDLVVAQKARNAKDGLYAFKGFADPSSIDKVIKHFLSLANKRVEEAWKQARGSGAVEGGVAVDDLEEMETPESVLIAAVTEEGSQERLDRVLLTPWLKFLWEAYRTVIDILRNNNKLETLYHAAAKEAFGFCLKYDRKHEFRRLCEILRNNLTQSIKYKDQAHSINLKSMESLHMHLEVRFEQFRVAGKLGLWQEAFKTIEDICSVIEQSGQTPKFNDLSKYYNYLASALWRSSDYNFHAATWHKLFSLTQEQKKTISADTLQQVCTNVVLATLCIPIASNDTEVKKVNVFCKDAVKTENQLRLVGLIGINSVPTRQELVSDMVAMNILAHVHPEVKGLYSLLEERFAPLELCEEIKPVLKFLEGSEFLSQYLKPLQYVVVMRLLKQFSQIYSTMKLDRLASLIPFASVSDLEKYVLQAVKDNVISIRVCHRTRSINFGGNLFAAQADQPDDGPKLQSLQSEMMRGQLTTLSRRLQKAVDMMSPARAQEEMTLRRQAVIRSVQETVEKEHRSFLSRRQDSENRRNYINILKAIKEKEKEKDKPNQHQIETEIVGKINQGIIDRQAEAQAQREEQIKIQAAIDSFYAHGGSRKVDLSGLSADEIRAKQLQLKSKEEQEKIAKRKANEKRVDYYRRAEHLEEIPLLRSHFESKRQENLEAWEEKRRKLIADARKQHQDDLELKAKLARMTAAKNTYVEKILAGRRKSYEEALEEYEAERARMEEQRRREEEARAQREREERQRLEAEARERAEQQQREEEERLQLEEERRQREEEQRRVEEQKRKEENDRLAKLDEIARKQRERELEIERREQEKRELLRKGAPQQQQQQQREQQQQQQGGAWRPSGTDWRAREASKQAAPAEQGSWRDAPRAEPPRAVEPRAAEPPRQESGGRQEQGSWRDAPPARPAGESGDWRRSEKRDDRRSFGGRREEEGPGGDRRGAGFGGPRREEEDRRSSGFGGPRREEEDRRSSGFGGPRREERGEGGFGGPRREERGDGGFGGPRRDGRPPRDEQERERAPGGPRSGAPAEREWTRGEAPGETKPTGFKDSKPPRKAEEEDDWTHVKKK